MNLPNVWNLPRLDTQTAEKPLTQFKSKADLHQGANGDSEASEEWSVSQIEALFAFPFNELMLKAQETHKGYFPEGDVESATLLSIN